MGRALRLQVEVWGQGVWDSFMVVWDCVAGKVGLGVGTGTGP